MLRVGMQLREDYHAERGSQVTTQTGDNAELVPMLRVGMQFRKDYHAERGSQVII